MPRIADLSSIIIEACNTFAIFTFGLRIALPIWDLPVGDGVWDQIDCILDLWLSDDVIFDPLTSICELEIQVHIFMKSVSATWHCQGEMLDV